MVADREDDIAPGAPYALVVRRGDHRCSTDGYRAALLLQVQSHHGYAASVAGREQRNPDESLSVRAAGVGSDAGARRDGVLRGALTGTDGTQAAIASDAPVGRTAARSSDDHGRSGSRSQPGPGKGGS